MTPRLAAFFPPGRISTPARAELAAGNCDQLMEEVPKQR